MTRDWLPLREHLELHISTAVDHLIANEQDPDWRAHLELRRSRMIETVADKMELRFLRDALAKRAARDGIPDGVVVQ